MDINEADLNQNNELGINDIIILKPSYEPTNYRRIVNVVSDIGYKTFFIIAIIALICTIRKHEKNKKNEESKKHNTRSCSYNNIFYNFSFCMACPCGNRVSY